MNRGAEVNKIGSLEGLRGLAALVVVNEHLLKLFFVMAFSDSAMRNGGVLGSLSFPPMNLLHNGAWAVCVFFVLSGYVLSQSFFSKKRGDYKEILGKVVARYFRLAVPITGSLLLVWIVMSVNGIYFGEVLGVTHSNEVDQYVSLPLLSDLFKQGFGSALFLNDYAYNPPLWTMSVEMIASIGIFIIHMVFLSFLNHKHAFLVRLAMYVGLVTILFPTMYTGFILGMLICDCKNNKRADILLTKYAKIWVPLAICVGLFLCGYMIRGLYTNPYSVVTFNEFNPYHEYLYNTWGAFFLVFGISYSKAISKLLSGSYLRALGKISFPLYLTHYIVMSSFTSYVYLALPIDSHYYKAVIAIALSIPTMFAVAYVFEKLINEPTVVFSRRITSVFRSTFTSSPEKKEVLMQPRLNG